MSNTQVRKTLLFSLLKSRCKTYPNIGKPHFHQLMLSTTAMPIIFILLLPMLGRLCIYVWSAARAVSDRCNYITDFPSLVRHSPPDLPLEQTCRGRGPNLCSSPSWCCCSCGLWPREIPAGGGEEEEANKDVVESVRP